MAKQRVVDTHFWDDNYIIDLDPIEKLLFLYLLTNPLTDICGVYEIRLKRISVDTGIDQDMIAKILERFEKAGKVIYKDGWILLVNFIRHQTRNPSVVQGITRSLNECPDWVRAYFFNNLDSLGTAWGEAVLLNLTKPNLTKHNLTEKPKADASALTDLFDLLRNYYGANILPDETGWVDTADFAFANGYTPQQVLDCLKSLSSETWRRARVSAKTVRDNLPEFVKKQAEPHKPQFDVDLSSLYTQ